MHPTDTAAAATVLPKVGAAKFSRRRWLGLAGGALGTALGARTTLARQASPAATPLPLVPAAPGERWLATWSAAPHPPWAGSPEIPDWPSQRLEFADQTLRQVVRASLGGDRVRLRLTNALGAAPLVVGAVRLALRDAGERIVPGSDRGLTFSGLPSITVPPGAVALSDPVDLDLAPLAEVAVSLYLPEPAVGETAHGLALQTSYLSRPGDATAEVALPVASTAEAWYFLAGLDVATTAPAAVVVALGDSITDGFGASPGAYGRWPDLLAARLAADPAAGPTAVANQGIGGNRLLGSGEGDFAFAGISALARFERDVLAQPGVSHLIVLEGINDIGLPAAMGTPDQAPGADQLVAALRQLAERARAHGIAPIGGTITPFAGAMYFTPEGEATRQAVNRWIRAGGAFAGVVDFDAAVRDPAQPARLLPAFDPGDHLHPNDAGYRAMAEAVDLALLRPTDGQRH